MNYIYRVKFITKELLLPSLDAVHAFLDEYKDLLTSTLLDKVQIIPLQVSKDSANYRNAIHNANCLKRYTLVQKGKT